MTLTAGQRLGPYEIQSALGAGGMGEVYRARDTRLDRIVAIKVMPAELATDPQFRERFEREARVISSLSHPHICALFDIGRHDDIDFLVMEYLEGDSLEQRLERSAGRRLPVPDALRIAIEIAGALDAAHHARIVHRDLKPGNVMLTKSGAKLLDFGLAKTAAAVVGSGWTGGAAGSAATTLASPLPSVTEEGAILGTFQYMAPEQIEGLDADARTDVFAFGTVLFEMLSGKKAFEGSTRASLIGAILRDEPLPLSVPQPLTTPALDHVVRRCLAKDPDERWQTASDLMRELKWIQERGGSAATVPAAVTPGRRVDRSWLLATAVSGLIIGVALASVVALWRGIGSTARSTDVVRTLVGVAPAAQIQDRGNVEGRLQRVAIALSPDGRALAFVGVRDRRRQLFLRVLDQLEAAPIAGTEDAANPFFSPDGKWLGFWASGEIRKVPIGGGPAVTICKAPLPFGASWGSDDRIVFSRISGGLLQVASGGGSPEPLTSVDIAKGEVSHRLPHALPGGDAILYTITRNRFPRWDETQLAVYSRRAHSSTIVIDGGADGQYVATGHVVYARQGVLMAAPFDLAKMKLTGSAVGLIGDVMQASYELASGADSGAAQYGVSETGALVYLPGGVAPSQEGELYWVDRTGHAERLPVAPRAFLQPRISPDGGRVAVATGGADLDIWTFDVSRGTFTRLTTEGRNGTPVWTPDGMRLTYRSGAVGPDNLFSRLADGTGKVERLTTSPHHQVPAVWSPDGKAIVYYDLGQDLTRNTSDLWVLPTADGSHQSRALVENAFAKGGADISPDGEWLAYHSNESGRVEVYVQPYGRAGARQQISTAGGLSPIWRRDGRELFYVITEAPGGTTGNVQIALMAAPVTTRPTLSVSVPVRLFSGSYTVNAPARQYDVTADGQRFLMIQAKERTSAPLTHVVLVQNWFEELRRRVPAAR